MKKRVVLSACTAFFTAFVLFTSFNAFAQSAQSKTGADYFAGKWDLLLEGLPQGDPRMIVSLQRKDGKLEGSIMDSTQKETAKISSVEETEKTVTVYFTANGYDVSLEMTKKDEDNVTVSLMGMFDGKGVRIKETN